MELRCLVAAGGLLIQASRLTAQTLPVPVLPREPAPEADPTLAGLGQGPPPSPEASEAPAPRPWEYAVSAGIGWDGNIDFLVPNGPRGVAVLPRASLARVFSGAHARLRAAAAGGWSGYPGQNDLRRYDADFDLDGSYRRSPNTEWRGSASYELGYSDSSRILLEQGVALPVVKTRSLAGALGVSRRAGAQATLRIDGRFYRTEFDSPVLIDGESLRGTLGLERQLSQRSTAAIEYSLEQVPSVRGSYLTHFGSFQWTRVFSLRSAVLLEAGASYTPDAARAGLQAKQSFFGGASFTRQLRRSSLTLFVRREVAPAFGTGQSRLQLRAGLGATIPMGRAWELRMLAIHVEPDARHDAGAGPAGSDDALAALGLRLGRRLEVSAEARYRRRGALGAIPAVEAFQAGLFLTLLTPNARAIAPAPGL